MKAQPIIMRLCAVAIAVCLLGLTGKAQSSLNPTFPTAMAGKWHVATPRAFAATFTITNAKSVTVKFENGDRPETGVLKEMDGAYVTELWLPNRSGVRRKALVRFEIHDGVLNVRYNAAGAAHLGVKVK